MADRKEMQFRITEKQERLRRLKMVMSYNEKDIFKNLDSTTEKWKTAAVTALLELLSYANEPKPSVTTMLTSLDIDPSVLDITDEDI